MISNPFLTMEERIQRKVQELVLEKYSGPFTANAFKNLFPSKYETYAQEVRPEAVQIVEQEMKIEEEFKQKCKEDMERTQQQWKKMQQDKKEEEENELIQQMQDRENPDKPLTFKDVRAYGFDYECSRRTLDELNVEILKRIIRREYSHKFKN